MINQYENLLRILILNILKPTKDSEYGLHDDKIKKWVEKRETEQKRYDGILSEKRLIFYSEFHELQTIIHKNWEKFLPVLQDKKEFDTFFTKVLTFRNTLAHGRVLFEYQGKLLEGIIGTLKTQITLFHNRNMSKDDFFIKILKLSDNYGNVWDDPESFFSTTCENLLRAGDSIEFRIEAFDPKDRPIEYTLKWGNFRAVNSTGHFKVVVENSMIGKNSWAQFWAKTPSESDYDNSDNVIFSYAVLPR